MKLRWYFIICIPIGLIALLFIGIVLVVGAEHEDRYAREGRELRERGPIHTLKLWKQYYRANALIDANTDKGYTPPPERHPNEITGNCPPVAKLPADMLVLLPPDTDSADAPWFMGSWAFGDRDIVLEVEVWSVRGGGRVVGNSFISVPYTKSWSTSGALKGTYIPIRSPIWVSPLSPGSIPLCPFSGGVSLSSGLIGDGYDKIPKRLAWISGNPHIFGDPMPEVESMQLIVAPRGDGSPKFSDQGTISRTEAGTYGFSGKFKFGDRFQIDHSLTEDEKELLIQSFEKDRVKLLNIYPQLSFVPPGGLGDELLGCNNDADFDGIDNAGDNCPNTSNPKQELLC